MLARDARRTRDGVIVVAAVVGHGGEEEEKGVEREKLDWITLDGLELCEEMRVRSYARIIDRKVMQSDDEYAADDDDETVCIINKVIDNERTTTERSTKGGRPAVTTGAP